ncbi:MAG: glycine C-acetyltransferase [Candidatus Heimdallarchaeota archaeon]|nr:glycine C-acetyltransferase [Candidatus Heimdallarchaeota archaeon]MDH5647794.1 glycine C-acetyltransferase [Candidatus Heimdallarchaeota archaeon]
MVKPKQEFMVSELNRLREVGLYNNIRTIQSPQGAWLIIDGSKVLNLCSNNYLGLANHPDLIFEAKKILDEFGVGPGAVRSIAGTMTLHKDLERVLSDFKGVENSLALQSGFVANQAVIPAIDADAIFTDYLNHASIIDGVRLTKAKRFIYEHNSVEDLAAKLEEGKDAEKKLIISDGVFSMDGDIAPVDEIVKVADEYNALVMIDDAHGEGVLGAHGRGIGDHFNLHNGEIDIEIGTLSKAIGVVGGFVAGSNVLIDYLQQKGRPFLFSSALTPPDVAAAIAAIKILEKDDTLVKKLWENAKYFQKALKDIGFDTGKTQTPITPIMIGEAKVASDFSKKLLQEGIFAMSIGFPTVPKGEARIRAMLSAAHEKEDLDKGIAGFEKVGKQLNII